MPGEVRWQKTECFEQHVVAFLLDRAANREHANRLRGIHSIPHVCAGGRYAKAAKIQAMIEKLDLGRVRTALVVAASIALTLAGNVLRATSLFFVETGYKK